MPLIIDYISAIELNRFYEIGKQIRKRNQSFELPWSEPREVEEFIENHHPEYKLIVGSNGSNEGRLIAFRFEDRPDVGYIGWYECDSDNQLATAILQEAIDWIRSVGAEGISGPMNGSSWGAFRFNTVSDKPLFVTEPHQPLYYIDQWKAAGFQEGVKYETHLVPKTISRPMPWWQVKLFALWRRIRVIKWPKNLIEDELRMKELHAFFHECFGENPLYRPVTFEQYKSITIKLEELIDFENSYLAVDPRGKPVSVLVSYKDVYHDLYKKGVLTDPAHDTFTLYMKTIATAKAWRGKHISRVLVNFGLVQAYKNGYDEVVFGTMMVNNKSAQYSKSFFDAQALRTYVFMNKEL
jgi:GNAT superfamily N-acetyltransferase